MSAYPKHTRPFTEPISAEKDQVIGPGKGLADLIRTFYEKAVPEKFAGRFGFLDRDNKYREYSPKEMDPYVFHGMSSLSQFRTSAHELMALLVSEWEELGFRSIKDEDRDIMVPDGKHAIEALKPEHPLHRTVITHRDSIYFILANADIVKKACVVRTINMGWWAVSYAGKNAPDLAYFRTSLNAHKRAVQRIISSIEGKAKYHALWTEAGDPILTNPGYPFFTAQLDASGNPVTRIKTVEMFRNVGRLAGGDWERLLEIVDERAGHLGLKGHPFAVAPLRRLQPGYKWQHQFTHTGTGLRSAYDERGVNSQRVAHMVPYVYNVLTSPMSTLYKAVRYFLPGCYHDGPGKQKRMARLREESKAGNLWLMEADYSNFDRFMPVNLIMEVIHWFTQAVDGSSFWTPAMEYLHVDASLIWPDYGLTQSGEGWVFKPGQLGLLSGVKATSETGTLVNSVVNGEALARTMGWDENQLFDYLTQYIDCDEGIGSKREYYYVQSDDTQLIQSDPVILSRHGDLFSEAVKAAGLKGSIEFADRFLMRHIQNGCDRPVPARVWQNTLSNESPPDNELIFLAGLSARTDGMFGLKSVDAFGTGTHQRITGVEARFTSLVVKQLRSFIETASHRSPTAIEFLTLLEMEGGSFTTNQADGTGLVGGRNSVRLSATRLAITKELARKELEAITQGNANKMMDTWLYQLHRDRNSPASEQLLSELLRAAPSLHAGMTTIMGKESAFFQYACEALNVKPLNL